MKLTEQRKGELYSLAEMLLWAPWPVVAVLSYQYLPSLVSFAWSAVFAMVALGIWVVARGTWRELKNAAVWKYAFVTAFFNGFAFHALYFVALNYTTPGNAALIGLLNALTNFLFFTYVRGERVRFAYVVGTALMMLGGAIVLLPNIGSANLGDLLTLIAVCCTPFGNFAMQKGRELVSAESLIFLRNVFIVPMIFLTTFLLGETAPLSDVGASVAFLFFNGVIVLALSKILFVEAIKRISVSKATALESAAPLVTLFFAWLLLGQVPTLWQVVAFIPLALGVLLLTDQVRIGKA